MSVICAELDTAASLWEPLDMVVKMGSECQEAALGRESIARVLRAAVPALGLALMFKEQPVAPGEPRCRAIWPRSWGMHTCIFRAVYCNMCKFIRAC